VVPGVAGLIVGWRRKVSSCIALVPVGRALLFHAVTSGAIAAIELLALGDDCHVFIFKFDSCLRFG